MSPSLPVWIARCEPSRKCEQASHCARNLADGFHGEVDASGCIGANGCGLFLDQRGLALIQETVQRAAIPKVTAQAQWFSPISREAA